MPHDDYTALFTQLAQHKLRIRKALHGTHATPRPGRGSLFYDRRLYTPGDDIRKIDWHAYARTRQAWIKLTQDEPDKTLHVILDTSRSMSLQGKWHRAKLITAGILFLAAKQNIPSILTLNPAAERVRGKGMRMLSTAISLLETITPRGTYTPRTLHTSTATQTILITDAHIPHHPLPHGTLIIRILNTADDEPREAIRAIDSETKRGMILTPSSKPRAIHAREHHWQTLLSQPGVHGITHHQEEDILTVFEKITS